jgi:hypothetical protein
MKPSKFLFRPADELELGGGGAVTEDPNLGEGSETLDTPIGETTENTETPAPKGETPAPGMTPADIARAVAETMQQFNNKKEEPAPKGRTIDEVRKQLDYYEVDDKVMETLFDVEATPQKRQAAFAEVQRKMYAHNMKVVEHMVEERLSQARQEYEPIRNEFLSRQQQKQVENFFNEYPGLAPHQTTVAMIAKQLPRNNPQTGKPFSDSELVSNIVNATKSYLKTLGHEVDPKKSSANPNTESTPSGVPKSKPLAGSGRSAPGSSPAPKTVSRDVSIWST